MEDKFLIENKAYIKLNDREIKRYFKKEKNK